MRKLPVSILLFAFCLYASGCGSRQASDTQAAPDETEQYVFDDIGQSPPRIEVPPVASRGSGGPEEKTVLLHGEDIVAPRAKAMASDAVADSASRSDRSMALTETERNEHTVIRVFYATDRKPFDGASIGGAVDLRPLTVPLIVAVISLAIAGLARLASRRKTAYALLAVGLLMSSVLAAPAILHWLKSLDRSGPALIYGTERGELQLGVCEVSIPKDHRLGEVESPSILRLEVRPDKTKHVLLLEVENKPTEEFFRELQTCVAQSQRREAFVFVHGYNVTFENAARRTAQVAHDLKFDGAPIFYSWPSQGSVLKYTVDENNVTWTVPHLKQFLLDVAEQSGASSIHLVAHSMGNRALTTALRELTFELKENSQLFNQVVLAAPDIDAEVFRRDIAPAIQRTAGRVTLYASSNDQALLASKQVHGYARAGDSGAGLVVIPGIETIDVSSVDTSLLGHSYYGDSQSIIADMYQLLHEKLPAQSRRWLQPMLRDGLTYWIFHARETEIASPGTTSSFR